MAGRGLLREPLVHFVILGGLLFALYQWVGAPAGAGGEIVVSEGRIRTLTDTFARTWQRPPTPAELDGLIEDFIREEVLYREGVALGLDRDDTVIRRRLRQKLEFISEGAADALEPTNEELQAFLAREPDRYRTESRVTFTQVYLDPARRGDRLAGDAAALLAKLRAAGPGADLAGLGDSRMLESRYEGLGEDDVAGLFGPAFEAALRTQPVGTWMGPLESGYGAHLVLVEDRTAGRLPPLDEVRPQVVRDWRASRRQVLLDQQYRELRARYRVRVAGR